jgi:hypothetical protein
MISDSITNKPKLKITRFKIISSKGCLILKPIKEYPDFYKRHRAEDCIQVEER